MHMDWRYLVSRLKRCQYDTRPLRRGQHDGTVAGIGYSQYLVQNSCFSLLNNGKIQGRTNGKWDAYDRQNSCCNCLWYLIKENARCHNRSSKISSLLLSAEAWRRSPSIWTTNKPLLRFRKQFSLNRPSVHIRRVKYTLINSCKI